MKRYKSVIICSICILLCVCMGIYTLFISLKLDTVTQNQIVDSSEDPIDYNKKISILEETNHELSKKLTEYTMSNNTSVYTDVESFIKLYFNRDYLSNDYNFYKNLYDKAKFYCTNEALDFFCPDIVVPPLESNSDNSLIVHYRDLVSDINVYSKTKDDGSVNVLAFFTITSTATSNSDKNLIINPEQKNVRLLNAKLTFNHELNSWVFDSVYQISTITGIELEKIQ